MFRSIVITSALVIAWGVFTGFMVDSAAGALRGAFPGLVITAPGFFNAAPLLIGIVVVALVDFGIRFGLQRRSLVVSA